MSTKVGHDVIAGMRTRDGKLERRERVERADGRGQKWSAWETVAPRCEWCAVKPVCRIWKAILTLKEECNEAGIELRAEQLSEPGAVGCPLFQPVLEQKREYALLPYIPGIGDGLSVFTAQRRD